MSYLSDSAIQILRLLARRPLSAWVDVDTAGYSARALGELADRRLIRSEVRGAAPGRHVAWRVGRDARARREVRITDRGLRRLRRIDAGLAARFGAVS